MKNLYNLKIQDSRQAAKTLSMVFFDYPTFTCIFPNKDERQKKLHKVMRFLVTLGIYSGEVVSTSNQLEAISIWYLSGNQKTTFLTILRSGFLGLLLSIKPASLCKFLSIGSTKEANRRSIFSGNYIFLDMIGVHPEQQKKGFGKILIQNMLEKYNGLNLPVYLETSNKNNVEYYKKYGFDLIKEYEIDKMKSYCMIKKRQ